MYYLGPETEILHQRYAKALMQVAVEDKKLDKIEKDLLSLNQILKKNELLARIFYHPEIAKREKKSLIEKMCKESHLCDDIKSFLFLLAKKDRLRLIHGVFLKYRDLYDIQKRRQKVFVRTADSLGKQQISRLKKILDKILNKEIFIEEVIEPSLIGGIDLKIGDTVYNLSLLTRLQFMKERLTQ